MQLELPASGWGDELRVRDRKGGEELRIAIAMKNYEELVITIYNYQPLLMSLN